MPDILYLKYWINKSTLQKHIMKAIIALLLTCSLSVGGMSIFEKTESVLHPHKDNKEQFNKEYINLLRKNPLQKKKILQAVVLSFDLTRDHISKLIDFTYPSFPRKEVEAADKKAYPAHWGDPPMIQTRDLRQLPGGYGMGSGTLAKWIAKHMEADKKNMCPPAEGGDEKGGSKEVLRFPVFPRPQNPLDVLTFPPVDYPPVTTPPSATD